MSARMVGVQELDNTTNSCIIKHRGLFASPLSKYSAASTTGIMGIFDGLMALILGWQVVMPAVDNGKYMMAYSPKGELVKMNTQDGTMVFCDAVTLKCPEEPKPEEPKKEIDYNVVDYR